jgi:hypothetical protein
MLQPTETVTRPDPGLARGRWEAPPWAFWAMLAVLLLGTLLYVLRRMGMLRFAAPVTRTKTGPARGVPTGERAASGQPRTDAETPPRTKA